ncbi:MAG: hypothetical protein KDC69_05690 [Flavobacteriaceae bacterium]|nr:hypothetical protein [Flavobacteriaceae bacterium]
MKKYLICFLAVFLSTVNLFAQPDYSSITFKSKLHEYKKKKPDLTAVDFDKGNLKEVVKLLGSQFYSDTEIDDITDRIWLSFTDPEKFDFVFKDLAIQTQPNWNKKNARGQIILEPNPFLAEWTQSDGELQYMQRAFANILSYYNLMAYSDDAISTKKSIGKLLFTRKMAFKQASSGDWTNSYLKYVNTLVKPKGYTALIAQGGYDFLICKTTDVNALEDLMIKLHWNFIEP